MDAIERHLAARIEQLVATFCGIEHAVELTTDRTGAACAHVSLEPYARRLVGRGRSHVNALVELWIRAREIAAVSDRLRAERPTVAPPRAA